MTIPTQSYVLSFAIAAVAGSLPASANTTGPAQTYTVTSISGSAAGNIIEREVLTVRRDNGNARIEVANADGSVISAPVRFTAQGQIASNARTGSLICYNMAMTVAANAGRPEGTPAAVFVAFAGTVVPVPLRLRATRTQGTIRDLDLDGDSTGVIAGTTPALNAGIVINANVELDGDALRGATFDEVQYVGSLQHPVGRSTCIIARVEARAQAQTNT